MNDPIKDFVEQHREEFDHLEAPVLKLGQLKAQLQHIPEVRKRNFRIPDVNRWLAAAIILMMLCTWLFFHNSDQEKPQVQLAQQQTKAAADKVPDAGNQTVKDNSVFKEKHAGTPLTAGTQVTGSSLPQARQEVNPADQKVNPAVRKAAQVSAPDLYAGLKDSTSASSRLLAILEIEKTGRVNNRVLDMLASTLNNDRSTNVRLAALSLMERYSDDSHVSSLLVSSLDKQEDPIVQLGLLSFLGKMKNVKIDDKLQSLASAPDTFEAVRDEAYSILLSQNKL